jgi:hypothetical protein
MHVRSETNHSISHSYAYTPIGMHSMKQITHNFIGKLVKYKLQNFVAFITII